MYNIKSKNNNNKKRKIIKWYQKVVLWLVICVNRLDSTQCALEDPCSCVFDNGLREPIGLIDKI